MRVARGRELRRKGDLFIEDPVRTTRYLRVAMESLEELIVREIRDNYSFLYNVRDRRYRNREERDKAWEEISSIVELDAKSCKTRWRSIRDRYLKERRRGSDSPERKKWRLVPLLGFLDDTLEAKIPAPTPHIHDQTTRAYKSTGSSDAVTVNGPFSPTLPLSRRTPSLQKKRPASSSPEMPASSPPTAGRRIILPAVTLPSPASRPPPSPGGGGGVFPVSLLKAGSVVAGGGPECRRHRRSSPAPPPPQPPAIASTTSLLLLPSPATSTTAFNAPGSNTATTSHAPGGGGPQRKETDQPGKLPLTPPQSLDEEDYYGLSVAGRLKKLSQRERALVRIEIEKLFLKSET